MGLLSIYSTNLYQWVNIPILKNQSVCSDREGWWTDREVFGARRAFGGHAELVVRPAFQGDVEPARHERKHEICAGGESAMPVRGSTFWEAGTRYCKTAPHPIRRLGTDPNGLQFPWNPL
jgi:hypothetical protein